MSRFNKSYENFRGKEEEIKGMSGSVFLVVWWHFILNDVLVYSIQESSIQRDVKL